MKQTWGTASSLWEISRYVSLKLLQLFVSVHNFLYFVDFLKSCRGKIVEIILAFFWGLWCQWYARNQISELYFTTKLYWRWSSNLVHCEIYMTDRVMNIYDWQKIHFWKIHFLSPLKFWQPYNFVGLTCWQNKQKNSSK